MTAQIIVPRRTATLHNIEKERNGYLSEILDILCRVVGGVLQSRGGVWDLIDFPDYPNVGDCAIWLGELQIFKQTGCRVSRVCRLPPFAPFLFHGRDCIAFHGGGNLGDIYLWLDKERRKILSENRNASAVIFPQSVFFQDPAEAEIAAEVYGSHPSLVLFVRDEESRLRARQQLRIEAEVVPDAAMAVGPLERKAPSKEVVLLIRTDREAAIEVNGSVKGPGVMVTDWLNEEKPVGSKVARTLENLLKAYPKRAEVAWRWLASMYRAAAKARLCRGVALLSKGKVVITDRLHGHILSVLLGIPHIVIDNSYGKIGAFYERWTKHLSFIEKASSLEEAIDRAGRMIKRYY